jgi:sensor histidine kinase YesM
MQSTLVLVALIGLASGYQPATSRRNLLQQAIVGAFVASSSPAEAVISSKYCSAGVGEGCGDLSEGNELIRMLQEKSAMNRERYQQVRRQHEKQQIPTSTGMT